MVSTHITPTLTFENPSGDRAGEQRFRLLAEIDRTGSISAAAKAVGLSYKGAWDAVNAMNNLFPRPVVIKKAGGARGGSADVTDEGRRALSVHRLLTSALSEILSGLETTVSGDPSIAFPANALLWSPVMRTSARNCYHGIVESVTHGAVNAEILLKISDDVVLTVIITEQSVTNLAIAPGTQAYALIKASTPILIEDDSRILTSARNRITGEIISVEPGAVNSEVVLDIGSGKTLCAIVTDDSAESLGLAPGKSITALIKSSQIILALG